MGYAFISYSSQNQASADAMRNLLNHEGIETWMAPGDIPAGSSYLKEINHALRDCSCLLLLLSEAAQNSKWVVKEVERAVHHQKTIIPVQIENVFLKDELEFVLCDFHVVAIQKIDKQTEEIKKVIASVRACTQNNENKLLYGESATEESESDSKIVSFQDAFELYSDGKYAAAFPSIKYYAEHDEPKAQCLLGLYYQLGYLEEIETDLSTAISWYTKAAENEDDLGQLLLGVIWYSMGDPENDRKAFEMFKLAAEQDNAAAQYYLGNCYYEGKGTEQNFQKALEYYRKSAENDDENGQYGLGKCYFEGKAIGQNYTYAVKWYKKAAKKGNASAQNYLGICYYFGYGVPQNYTEAIRWFERSVEQGNAEAQANLGSCYAMGIGVEQDADLALDLYRKSADQGNAHGERELAGFYYNGNVVEQDYDEAYRLYRASAEQGDSGGQNGVGLCYYFGRGVAKDLSEALRWFALAAEQNNTDGLFNFANCYYTGTGVDQNYAEAFHYFSLADEQGDTSSKYYLGKCYYYGQGVDQDTKTAIEILEKAVELDPNDQESVDLLKEIRLDLSAKGLCPYCGGQFVGLLKKKCSVCGRSR